MSFNCLPAMHLAALLACALLVMGGGRIDAQTRQTGRRDRPVSLTRVRVKFEVAGNLRMAGDTKPPTLPMTVAANFDYFERRIDGSTDDGSANEEPRSIRHYAAAQAAIRVNNQEHPATLADEHRLIKAAVIGERAVVRAARGFLTRDERDLIELPFNTLLLDSLL